MFDISILQKDLMEALKAVESTVGKNTQNLGDNCISMISDANGLITLCTTNLIEFTKVCVIANSTGVGSAPLVDFKRFKGIISSIPKGEYITLKESVNDLLISFAMRKPIKLTGCTTGTVPYPSITPNKKMTLPTGILKSIVESANSILKESAATPIYNCVKITTDLGNITSESFDISTKRTAFGSFINSVNNPNMSVLLEAIKLQKSINLFDEYSFIDVNIDSNTNAIELTGNALKVTTPSLSSVSYAMRNLNGVFPSLSVYYGTPPTESMTISKAEFLNSISRVKAIGDESSLKSGIQVIADKGDFRVKFSSPYGDMDDPVDVTSPITGSFAGCFLHNNIEEVVQAIYDTEISIGRIPNSPGSFLLYGVNNNEIKYTITGMASQQAQP